MPMTPCGFVGGPWIGIEKLPIRGTQPTSGDTIIRHADKAEPISHSSEHLAIAFIAPAAAHISMVKLSIFALKVLNLH